MSVTDDIKGGLLKLNEFGGTSTPPFLRLYRRLIFRFIGQTTRFVMKLDRID
jgi:hypothetical protein